MCGGGGGVLSSIGSALSSAVQGIGGAVENIIKNPLPVIETIALTALVIATAGAAAPAAFALESGFIAAGTASALGGGAIATAVGVGVQQAVIAAAVSALNGGDVRQVGTAALQAGVTAGLTYGVAQNLPGALSSNPLQPDTLAKVASGAIGGAAGAAASAAITGQPIGTAALVGGVAGGTGAYIGDALKGTDFAKEIGTTGVKILTTAGAAGAGAIAGGKNAGYAATMAAINVGLATSLSNFQATKQEVQDKIASSPELQDAAKAVNDAAASIKNMPADVLAQINNVSKVQQAATNISDQITSSMGGGALTISNADIQTLKDTGQFNEQVNQLETLASGGAIQSGPFAGPQTGILMPNGVYKYDSPVTLALATSLTDGAKAYAGTISSLSPQIQAYVDNVNTVKTNTLILDTATNNQFSALTNNTQKLMGSVTDYGNYSTQVNNGTLTSTPQQDALNKQIADQNTTVMATARIVNDLDPNSPEYAAAAEKYQAEGEKLVNLAAQSAALNNYFSGDKTSVTGANVADIITKAGGSADLANAMYGFYTDNGLTAPSPVLLDSSGNVILASKDASGNLTNVYSVGSNGSQAPTTDQLQQIAASNNPTAKTFANDASKLLTGQELSTTLANNINNPGQALVSGLEKAATTVSGSAQAAETGTKTPPQETASTLAPVQGYYNENGDEVFKNAQGQEINTGRVISWGPQGTKDEQPAPGTPSGNYFNAATGETANAATPNQVIMPLDMNNLTPPPQTVQNNDIPSNVKSTQAVTNNNGTVNPSNATAENVTPGSAGSVTSENVVPGSAPINNTGTPNVAASNSAQSTTDALTAINATPNTAGGSGVTPAAPAAPGTTGGTGTMAGTTGGTGTMAGTTGGTSDGSNIGLSTAGAGLGLGLGLTAAGSIPTSTASPTTTSTTPPTLGGVSLPVAQTIKGTQIKSPLENYAPQVNAYTAPTYNPHLLEEIEKAKNGGIMHMAEGGFPAPQGLLHGRRIGQFGSAVNPMGLSPMGHYEGGGGIGTEPAEMDPVHVPPGMPEGHNPQFFSEGGLNTLKHTFVNGEGDGTSDSIPAMLANGEFVIPADVVSGLGNGSNDAGAKVLDQFLSVIRSHKQKHDSKQLPPDSKGPLGYLLEAKRKVNT